MNSITFVVTMIIGGDNYNATLNAIFFVAILAVMYFFMIRPQAKRAKEQEAFMEDLKRGSKVVTIGGIHGKIVKVGNTTVTIEVDSNTKLKVEKSVVSMEFTKGVGKGKSEASTKAD